VEHALGLDLDTGAQSVLQLPPPGVYAITPPQLSGASLHAAVRACLEGGAVMLQLRAVHEDAALLRADALALKALCAKFGVPLLINNSVELAHALGLGVHLGETDMSIGAARALLGPEALIGASCYDSVVLAQRACDAGASYIAFGRFFVSQSKDQPRQAELKHLQKARALGVPIVAIGGITLANAAPLVQAGADYLAVIGGIFGTPGEAGPRPLSPSGLSPEISSADISHATRALAALYRGAGVPADS
jgi:thiamine-phosphate pyrophosphorylase